MNDHQPYLPPGSGDEQVKAGGRRVFVWLLGCLGAIAVVVVALVLTLFLVTRGDDEQVAAQPDSRQGSQEAAITVEPTGLPVERPTDEPATGETEPAPAGEPAQPSPDLPEQDAAEPAPTEPPASASATPQATATAEPTATEVAPVEPPAGVDVRSEIAGRIAVVDSRARLWTVAADGSDRRLLSERGRAYQFPSWSPAGNDIAVIGSDFEGSGVYVVTDEPDGAMRHLYSDSSARPIYLYWSPEGEYVSFIAGHPDGLALHLVPGDGAAESEVVTTSPSTFFWDWMPDGSQVLIHTGFTARDSDNSRLAFVPLDDGGESQEIVQRGHFQAPVVAADGRFFSYSDADPGGNHWLSVRDIDRDQQVELVFHRGVVAMGFSPTGPQLAYTSPEGPEDSFYGPLRMIDLDSGESRQLVPEMVLAFFWSPDGRSIAYLTLASVERPFEFDDAPVAGLLEYPVTSGRDGFPGVSKEDVLSKARSQDEPETRIGLGLSIVDIESGETRLLTVFEPSTVFLNQFLPFFDQYALSHRLWSPDSSALVLPMEDVEDRDFIVVVPVDGSDPLPIARGVAAFWSHQ